jgi:hypothetical protein
MKMVRVTGNYYLSDRELIQIFVVSGVLVAVMAFSVRPLVYLMIQVARYLGYV